MLLTPILLHFDNLSLVFLFCKLAELSIQNIQGVLQAIHPCNLLPKKTGLL